MYWGQPWTAPWGAPDNLVSHLECAALADGRSAVMQVAPAAGCGDMWFELFLQDRRAAHFYAPENHCTAVPVTLPAATALDLAPVGFALYGLGGWSFPPYSLLPVHLAATTADRGRCARFNWAPTPVLDAVHGDPAAQLSNWSLIGLRRNGNHARVPELPTRSRLYWTLQDAAGTRTVTLFADAGQTQPVAQGARSGDGPVALTAVGGSDLIGAVTVAYTSAVATDAWLDLRWPARYELFANRGAGSIDFDTPLAVIPDNGRDESFTWISAELAAGTWEFCLRSVSDTGVSTANTAAQIALTVAAPPAPPGLPVYNSGDATTGLVLDFLPSLTAGATYRLYRSLLPGGAPDTATPDATAAAGATQISSTALTGGPGRYGFLLMAVDGVGESLNAETVALTVDAAGAVLSPRPPAPQLADFQVAARTVTACAQFHPDDGEPGAATVAWIDFYLAAETAAIDWTLPAISVAPAPTSAANGWRQAQTALPPAGADGWYQLAARCRTAAGDRGGNSAVRWVFLSSAAPAVAELAAALIR